MLPRSFQGRLALSFISVIALTLALVTILVLNRLDDYFTRQQTTDLEQRADTVNSYVQSLARGAIDDRLVVTPGTCRWTRRCSTGCSTRSSNGSSPTGWHRRT